MKSPCEWRARADLQKCGFAERWFPALVCRLVKLQRPPPDIRIFLPTRLALSITSTRRPRAPAVAAHIRPAAPPPTTITSNCCTVYGIGVGVVTGASVLNLESLYRSEESRGGKEGVNSCRHRGSCCRKTKNKK